MLQGNQIKYEFYRRIAKESESEVTQLCLTLCDPMNCSSSVHGIFQTRILEWAAISFSRGSFRPSAGSPALQADALRSERPGKPEE